MERKVGEMFYDDGVAIKCIEVEDITCVDCYYTRGKKLCNKKHGYVGRCNASDREDKKNVKFVCV